MVPCKFLERYQVPTVVVNGTNYIESERCRLGNEVPLGGCLENCPDFEPGTSVVDNRLQETKY